MIGPEKEQLWKSWYGSHYQKAIVILKIAQEIGDRSGEGTAYGNIGCAYQSLGDYRKAIEYHEKRLKIAQEIGDRSGEGAAYGNRLCLPITG